MSGEASFENHLIVHEVLAILQALLWWSDNALATARAINENGNSVQ